MSDVIWAPLTESYERSSDASVLIEALMEGLENGTISVGIGWSMTKGDDGRWHLAISHVSFNKAGDSSEYDKQLERVIEHHRRIRKGI